MSYVFNSSTEVNMSSTELVSNSVDCEDNFTFLLYKGSASNKVSSFPSRSSFLNFRSQLHPSFAISFGKVLPELQTLVLQIRRAFGSLPNCISLFRTRREPSFTNHREAKSSCQRCNRLLQLNEEPERLITAYKQHL